MLAVLAEVWAPIEKFTPEMVDKHLSSGVIDSVDPGDTVINSEFRLDIGAQQQVFHVLWPLDTVASLLPVLEGQKRERDAAEDARWARCLRARCHQLGHQDFVRRCADAYDPGCNRRPVTGRRHQYR